MAKFILKCECGNTILEYLDDICLYYCKKCDTEFDINFDLYELVTEVKGADKMLTELKIIGKYNKELVEEVKQKYMNEEEGISELYDQLYVTGYCRSYNIKRIYYVAYTLAKNNVELEINKL